MLAIGLKLNIDCGLCQEETIDDYLSSTSLELDEDIGIDADKNPATATHYNNHTGEIFFTFAFPVQGKNLERFFTEEEIIYKIQN